MHCSFGLSIWLSHPASAWTRGYAMWIRSWSYSYIELYDLYQTQVMSRKINYIPFFCRQSRVVLKPPLAFITPCTHAHRGKVIGSVIVVITEIARSRISGVFVGADCCYLVTNSKKTSSWPSRLSKGNHESCQRRFFVGHAYQPYLQQYFVLHGIYLSCLIANVPGILPCYVVIFGMG